jgi:hypothetical protein
MVVSGLYGWNAHFEFVPVGEPLAASRWRSPVLERYGDGWTGLALAGVGWPE